MMAAATEAATVVRWLWLGQWPAQRMESLIPRPDLPLEDETLLARVAKERSAAALEELYNRHSGLVKALLLRITGQHPVADELTQEVFFRLWRNAALAGLQQQYEQLSEQTEESVS